MRTLILFYILAILACQNRPSDDESEAPSPSNSQVVDGARTSTEKELTDAVERFLFAAGNYDTLKMREFFLPYANIGAKRIVEEKWSGESMSFEGYLEKIEGRTLIPYYEPVHRYTTHVSEDQLAFVMAEAKLHRFGIPRSNNTDFFTLMRTSDAWKIINVSYTSSRLPESDQIFDLEAFAKGYAQAWSGVRPEFVAMFFEEEGSLRVNDGDAAVGREAITGVARSFMTDLPDMVVSFDSLVNKGDMTEFHWTLTGTNTGPGGTGNKVRVAGYEEWTFGENGLVKRSQGHFPSEEYQRQLQEGYIE